MTTITTPTGVPLGSVEAPGRRKGNGAADHDESDQSLGLDALITEALELVGSGVTVTVAAWTVVDARLVIQEPARTLCHRGLAEMVHDRLGTMRSHTPDPEHVLRGRFQWHTPSGQQMADILARLPYEGADGVVKPLIAFTADDCDHFAVVAASIEAGWGRKGKAVRTIAGDLRKHGAATVGDLPAERLSAARSLVEGAWT